MTKQVHTILCWILAVSLVWLPLSVSADTSLFAINKAGCHEMNSHKAMSMSGHEMPNHEMPGHDVSNHSRHSATSGKTAESGNAMLDHSVHASIIKKACCDQCDDNCATCTGMTSCAHSSNHISAFILFDQYASQSLPLVQSSNQSFVQYHNQIITPDFRPPIV